MIVELHIVARYHKILCADKKRINKMLILSKILAKMNLKNFLLIHLVFIMVIFDVLAGNVQDVIKEFRQFYNQKAESKESHHERRLEKIKDILPEHGIVGYFTNREYNTDDDTMFFYLTQYALSPLIILRGTKPQIIIADVNDSFNIIEFNNKYNCRLLKNFGDGILVFRKRTE
jgi:hypothetical protein